MTAVMRQTQEYLLRLCVQIVAHLVKRTRDVKLPMIHEAFAYRVAKIPFNASMFISWNTWRSRTILPLSLHIKPHWYQIVDHKYDELRKGTIIVRVHPGDQSPHYVRISGDGTEQCLHTASTSSIAQTNVLEARLLGKRGSIFYKHFPKGVKVTHLLRLPTYARLTEVLPCILVTLAKATEHAAIKYEDPKLLYLYILMDDTFDEVTLQHDDRLVVP